MGEHNIVQFPRNHIPRGLVPLEEIFYLKDFPFKPMKRDQDPAIHEHNIGSQGHPKFINLSSELTVDQNSKLGSLMKGFADIFAWE